MNNDTRFATLAWRILDSLQNKNQIEEAFQDILETLVDVMKCKEASLWIKHEKDQRIYLISSIGNEDNIGLNIPYGEGKIGEVANKGEILLDGYSMMVPLKTPFSILGVLSLSRDNEIFKDDDAQLINNCASLIALDIEDKGFDFDIKDDRKVLVSLRGVIKEFMSGEELRRILKGIDLDVYEGELLVVLGESGCGKSTMLNIIGGMDTLSDGNLIIEGKDFSHPSEDELTQYRRDYIGFIFQSYNLMPNLTALENVKFIAEISKRPLDSLEVLSMVGLSDRANRYPSAMSGGQQQRVCIARALVKDPKIILADEPTAALDYTTGQGVLKIIERIVKERKTTVIMVTHNVEIAKMADRVIKLKDGKISSIRSNFHPLPAESLVW